MKIAGLDIGTTGCKLTVFDENGKELGKAYRDYPVKRYMSDTKNFTTQCANLYNIFYIIWYTYH